jgi:hypothetical protein
MNQGKKAVEAECAELERRAQGEQDRWEKQEEKAQGRSAASARLEGAGDER